MTQRVLVVDDEPAMGDVISIALEPDQFEVKTAINGREALQAIQEAKFDLVIVDYQMPGMKGDKLAAAIKALAPEQQIIMMTGHQEALRFAGDFPLAVDLVLNKPCTGPELREAVRQLVQRLQLPLSGVENDSPAGR